MAEAAIDFMVGVANAIYQMSPEDRAIVIAAIASVVTAMDEFSPELEPEVIYAKDEGRLVLTFNGDPERPPVVVDMPTGAIHAS